MNMLNLFWRLLSPDDRDKLLLRMNAVDRTYYQDLFRNKKLSPCFVSTKSIFIHVPKCAGSSICDALYGGEKIGHRPASWYHTQYPEQYRDFFTFSFTRNPWDRLVSAWTYLRAQTNSHQDSDWAEALGRYRSFDDFVINWVHAGNIERKIHFCPQHLYLLDNFGTMSLDYVGKVEDFQKGFDFVAAQLGLSVDLKRVNQSRNDDYRSYYNDKTIAHVEAVYQRDIQLFGYEFE